MSGDETDYLVIGAGAIGMAFVDSLLDHGPADTRITIIDRHPKPGGHWNTSYPFVTLHQPSVTYGLSQLPLNDGVIDQAGPNAGFGELASGAQVQAYYDHAMRHKFVPSGRVRYLPMTDYEGGADGVHRIRTILSGDVREIGARKLVDGRKFAAQVPTITKRKWQADGVLVMTPGELGTLAYGGMAVPGHFVIMGGGKTACDVGVWLLQMGVSARQISWVRPRDTWFFNRASIQTGADHLAQAIDFPRSQMRAAAAAASGAEIFHMMEADGHMLRIDRDSEPTKFHFPTISQAEVDLLATIEDAIRIGRVTSVIPGTLTGVGRHRQRTRRLAVYRLHRHRGTAQRNRTDLAGRRHHRATTDAGAARLAERGCSGLHRRAVRNGFGKERAGRTGPDYRHGGAFSRSPSDQRDQSHVVERQHNGDGLAVRQPARSRCAHGKGAGIGHARNAGGGEVHPECNSGGGA